MSGLGNHEKTSLPEVVGACVEERMWREQSVEALKRQGGDVEHLFCGQSRAMGGFGAWSSGGGGS